MMKKHFLRFSLLFLLLLMVLSPCHVSAKSKRAIRMKKTILVVKKGNKLRLKYRVVKKYKHRKIKWTSSNCKIVKVDKKGRIWAKAKGRAVITARIKGTKYKARCTVIVENQVRKSTSSSQVTTRQPVDSSIPKQEQPVKKDPIIKEPVKEDLNPKGDQEESGWASKEYDQKIASTTSNSAKLLLYLEKYSSFIKYYGDYFYRDDISTASQFSVAMAKVQAGTKVAINCVSPLNWALKEMGFLLPADSIYGNYSEGFVISSEESRTILKQNAYFTVANSASLQNKTLQQAAEEGYFKPGDCVTVKKYNEAGRPQHHTVTYIGMNAEDHALFYEAGNIPYHGGYRNFGCGPIDYYGRNNYFMVQVMRFKN